MTQSMLQMNPTVPKTLIGGKSRTVSKPFLTSTLKATELDKAIVGI